MGFGLLFLTALTAVLAGGVALLHSGLLWLVGRWRPPCPPGWLSVTVVLATTLLLLGVLFRLDAP